MASKQITVGIGIPMIITGFLIAIFWAPLVGDVKDTVEFVGSLIGIIGIILASTLLSSKLSDLKSEIGDLRVQRKLLKEEIKKITRRGKPQPRRSRKR